MVYTAVVRFIYVFCIIVAVLAISIMCWSGKLQRSRGKLATLTEAKAKKLFEIPRYVENNVEPEEELLFDAEEWSKLIREGLELPKTADLQKKTSEGENSKTSGDGIVNENNVDTLLELSELHNSSGKLQNTAPMEDLLPILDVMDVSSEVLVEDMNLAEIVEEVIVSTSEGCTNDCHSSGTQKSSAEECIANNFVIVDSLFPHAQYEVTNAVATQAEEVNSSAETELEQSQDVDIVNPIEVIVEDYCLSNHFTDVPATLSQISADFINNIIGSLRTEIEAGRHISTVLEHSFAHFDWILQGVCSNRTLVRGPNCPEFFITNSTIVDWYGLAQSYEELAKNLSSTPQATVVYTLNNILLHAGALDAYRRFADSLRVLQDSSLLKGSNSVSSGEYGMNALYPFTNAADKLSTSSGQSANNQLLAWKVKVRYRIKRIVKILNTLSDASATLHVKINNIYDNTQLVEDRVLNVVYRRLSELVFNNGVTCYLEAKDAESQCCGVQQLFCEIHQKLCVV